MTAPPDSPGTFAQVALDVPIAPWFDYAIPAPLARDVQCGAWVVVPWGKARRVGIVIGTSATPGIEPERVRALHSVLLDAPVLQASWLAQIRFAARYYHRSIGEVALPALPKLLRMPPAARTRGSPFKRGREHAVSLDAAALAREVMERTPAQAVAASIAPPALTVSQKHVLAQLRAQRGFCVSLLHGITGSGKTEVYSSWLGEVLQQDANAQVLLLVPEIALTPQLANHLTSRFAGLPMAILHSHLADGERAAHWLAAVEGRARLIVGTRLAVLAPIPHLAAIVVDEEHDASYRQQEGVHYSARDLAVVMASQRGIPIVLGSATPSLESWHAAQRKRYSLLSLPERATGAALPRIVLEQLRRKPLKHGLTAATIETIRVRLARKERVLVFLNRRGYAPVLSCEACGWVSRCETCTAFRVLHRLPGRKELTRGDPPWGDATTARYQLLCHHCSANQAVPRACPTCGNVDLVPLGRGTQRIEEGLAELFPDARIARLDRDVARRKGAAQKILAAAHAGDVDILVGTQMLAKGHDFRGLSLVVVVDADAGLYAADFRAPERLFATLMQVAGRAGRDAPGGVVLIQTRFVDHPLFDALARHDFAGFAAAQLAERQQAGLPPFVFQALLRAQARDLADAIAFLAQARRFGADNTSVRLFDPVPMAMMRIAGIERAQLLLESDSRPALHTFIEQWLPQLRSLTTSVRWQLDIDPLEI